MTRPEILARWPNASEDCIKKNLSAELYSNVETLKVRGPFIPRPMRVESEEVVKTNPISSPPSLDDWLIDINMENYERVIMSFTIKVKPMGAPRMNRSDAWNKRDCVLRYRKYQDTLRSWVENAKVPDAIYFKAYLPMPPSWSKKEKEIAEGMPHQAKPDADNLCKGIFDSLFHEDCSIWNMSGAKYWTEAGRERIELKLVYYKRIVT